MNTRKKALASKALIAMTGLFLMITVSSPARDNPVSAEHAEKQMGESTQDTGERSPVVRFAVDTDALINRLTFGSGGGSNVYNTAAGFRSLRDNGSGTRNTAIGAEALRDNVTGTDNIAIGFWALLHNKANMRSTVIGNQAMRFADNSETPGFTYNTAVGYEALRGSLSPGNNTGRYNTAVGDMAIKNNTTGSDNSALGVWALRSNTTGIFNTAVGSIALVSNNTGNRNTALGRAALSNNEAGSENTAIGAFALNRNKGNDRSTAIGYQAMRNADSRTIGRSTFNTAVGYQALQGSGNSSANTGRFNTAVGGKALLNNTTGSSNTAVGNQALGNNTSGNWNTAIGRNALPNNTTGSENTSIGESSGGEHSNISISTFIGVFARASADNLSNVTGIGYNARPNASNRVRIGNASVAQIGGFTGWSNVSDAKYKSNIEENVPGLEFVLRLRPVTYNMDAHKLAAHLGEDMRRDEDGHMKLAEPSEAERKARNEKSAILYSGFLAQEVEQAARELGYEFSGVDVPKHEEDFYSLRYAEFVVPIVKAIQEQQAQIETLSPEGMDELLGKVDALEAHNALLVAEQEALRAENHQIRAQMKDILELLADLGVEIRQCCDGGTGGMGPEQVYQPDANQLPTEERARLEQNAPNPFQENTLIRYYLPVNSGQARITLSDLGGNTVKSFPLSGYGHGQILINGGTMKAGTYVYTMIVDGRQVESKRMVLL